ncbi:MULTISPECIES: carbohydrate ABC transporter permease [Mesobacillus]|nr:MULTISPECIES: sugar ABC transporter permease [Mesobacillus]MDQ0415298.1 raffinose/stachyose/melibiose transport system permease protein [Mesobacillus stamsii]
MEIVGVEEEVEMAFNGKNREKGSKRLTDFFITLPGLIIYSVFFVIPLLMGLFYSFTDWNGISQQFNVIGFENYQRLIDDERFIETLGFTFKYSFFLIVGVIFFAITIALILESKNLKGFSFFTTVFFVPAVMSLVTVGMIFKEMYYRALPALGQNLGIEALSTNILSNPDMAGFGILFANIWTATAIPMVLFAAALQNVPGELYEAAEMDGASYSQKFKHVTFAYLIPTISIVFILQLKAGLGVFDYVMAITGGGPAGATESIGTLIYKLAFEERRFGYSVTVGVIVFLLIAAISLIQVKLTQKKEVSAE